MTMYWFVHIDFTFACVLLLLGSLLLCGSNKLLERIHTFDTKMAECRVCQINISLALADDNAQGHADAIHTFGCCLADTDQAFKSVHICRLCFQNTIITFTLFNLFYIGMMVWGVNILSSDFVSSLRIK